MKSKNWLIAALRRWHTWLGVAAAFFILAAALSGIILNYKKPIFAALGVDAVMAPAQKTNPGRAVLFSTANGFDAAAISPETALSKARDHLGDVALERIELKLERGDLFYKIKQLGGDELWVNAASGATFVKNEYRKEKKGPEGISTTHFDWSKFILDLPTGKIAGEFGKALMSAAALVLLFLTGSGIYLWIKPLLIRHKNAAARKAPELAPNSMPIPIPSAAVTKAR